MSSKQFISSPETLYVNTNIFHLNTNESNLLLNHVQLEVIFRLFLFFVFRLLFFEKRNVEIENISFIEIITKIYFQQQP